MKLLTLLFCCLLASAPARADDPYATAAFLDDEISFLSQYDALAYAAAFEELRTSCLKDPRTVSHEQRLACVRSATEEIRRRAEADHPERALRDRFLRLTRAGHLEASALPRPGPIWGVVGDSFAVGAMAHNRVGANLPEMLAKGIFELLFLHLESGSQKFRPEGNAPSSRVFDVPTRMKQGWKRLGENRASSYIDCPECTFAYELAAHFGLPPENLFFAGQSGKEVNSLFIQLERLALPFGHLPDVVLISYSGNDLCHANNANELPETKYRQLRESLVNLGREALSKLRPAPGGTRLVFLGAPDISQVLTNPAILQQRVPYRVPGSGAPAEISCREMRERKYPLLEQLNSICRFVLNTNPSDSARVAQVRALSEAMVRAQRDAASELQVMANARGASPAFRVDYLPGLQHFVPAEGELAHDCAHPSRDGHRTIGRLIYPELKALLER